MAEYRSYIQPPNSKAIKKAYIQGLAFGYSQYAKFAVIGLMFYFGVIVMEKYDLGPFETFTAVYTMYTSAIGTGFNLA